MVVAEKPLAPAAPVLPERSQKTRRPPRYLADYAVGHLELPSREGSPSSMDDYLSWLKIPSITPENFTKKKEIQTEFRRARVYASCLFEIQRNFPRVA